jgi:hypothetical protein
LLLAIAVYVSLDLCVAAMPGAFVFEPADSVESAQTGRARAPAELAALPPESEGAFTGVRPAVDLRLRHARRDDTRPPARHVPTRQPPSARDSSSPQSEDPD